jgi:hypothetical protein
MFIVAWVMSIGLMVLVAAGVVTYIRRTWQQIASHTDESVEDRILDGLDQLQTQLYMLSERLERIERRLGEGEGDGAHRLPGSADPAPPDGGPPPRE